MARGGSAVVQGGSSGSRGQGPTGPALRELARAPRNEPNPPQGTGKPTRLYGKEAGYKFVLACREEMNRVGKGRQGRRKSVIGKT